MPPFDGTAALRRTQSSAACHKANPAPPSSKMLREGRRGSKIKRRHMQYLNLGKTGMKVSRLCLGMMSYGSKQWSPWVLEQSEAKPFIQRAFEAGINFFDTADVYSTGESERITGNLLKELGVKRENIIVATKVNGQ